MQVTGISNAALLRALAEDVPDMHPTVRNQLLCIAKSIEAPAAVNQVMLEALKCVVSFWEQINCTNDLYVKARAAIAAAEAQPVGINGLTEAETNATMSVMGLSKPAQPLELSDDEVLDMAGEVGIEFQSHTSITGRKRVTTYGSQPLERIKAFALAAANKKAGL